jgi:hypothetical protein
MLFFFFSSFLFFCFFGFMMTIIRPGDSSNLRDYFSLFVYFLRYALKAKMGRTNEYKKKNSIN